MLMGINRLEIEGLFLTRVHKGLAMIGPGVSTVLSSYGPKASAFARQLITSQSKRSQRRNCTKYGRSLENFARPLSRLQVATEFLEWGILLWTNSMALLQHQCRKQIPDSQDGSGKLRCPMRWAPEMPCLSPPHVAVTAPKCQGY